jgi:ATP-dependent RNA helicase MSS116
LWSQLYLTNIINKYASFIISLRSGGKIPTIPAGKRSSMAFLQSWSRWTVLSSATRSSCLRSCTPSTTGCEYLRAKLHPAPSDDFEGLSTLQFRHASTAARSRDRIEKSFGQYKEVDPNAEKRTFESMKGILSEETLRAVTQSPYKFTHMSPVQAAVFDYLPPLSDPFDPESPSNESEPPPRDILVRAKTGTGKTAAFVIPAIEQRVKTLKAFGEQALVDSGLSRERFSMSRVVHNYARENAGVLIISPTRELATQIAKEASNLAYHQKDLQVQLFIGGSSKHRQMRDWMTKRRDIVVATPGRLRDVLTSEPAVTDAFKKTALVCDPSRTAIVLS